MTGETRPSAAGSGGNRPLETGDGGGGIDDLLDDELVPVRRTPHMAESGALLVRAIELAAEGKFDREAADRLVAEVMFLSGPVDYHITDGQLTAVDLCRTLLGEYAPAPEGLAKWRAAAERQQRDV